MATCSHSASRLICEAVTPSTSWCIITALCLMRQAQTCGRWHTHAMCAEALAQQHVQELEMRSKHAKSVRLTISQSALSCALQR